MTHGGVMLAYCLASGVVIGVGAGLAYCCFPTKPLSALLTLIAAVLTQISLITLVLGILNRLDPAHLVIGSFSLGLLGLGLLLWQFRRWGGAKESGEAGWELNQWGRVAVGSVAVILALPFFPMLQELMLQIRNVHPLSWDVVSYHLPNTVDYLQSKSLWTLQGAFSQYPGGNELLILWSFIPLGSDVMLGLTTLTLGLGLMLATTLILQKCAAVQHPILGSLQIIGLWLLCFAIPAWQTLWFDLGRNDLTLSFWLILALWTLTQALTATRRQPAWLLWTGINLGLAIGTKPNGLYYGLGFFVLSLCPIFDRPAAPEKFHLKLWQRFQTLGLPIILIAGFWYGRNWWLQGQVFSPEILRPGAELTILSNLNNPQLYRPSLPLFVLVGALIITGICLAVSVKYPAHCSPTLRLLAWVNLLGIGAWVLTPHGAGYWIGDQMVIDLQLRYAAYLIPLSTILLITLIALGLPEVLRKLGLGNRQFFQGLQRLVQPRQERTSRLTIIVGCGITSLVIGLQLLTFRPAIGLPGYTTILFGVSPTDPQAQHSQVYEWLQDHVRNSKIYNLGLRPYGLYGVGFSNRVIDGGSPQAWAVKPFAQVLASQKPDYIAITVDPFSGQVSPEIRYFFQQPQQFQLVYQDSLAVVFKVQVVR